MRQVIKGSEPPAFTDWKDKANEAWQPDYEILQNPEKQALHEALLIEQDEMCCYCGRFIRLEDSHIEHFRPQETRKDLALEYSNLHASCIRETKPGIPLHCGHAKANAFDEAQAISPLDSGCEQRFIYTLAGAIHPADPNDTSADYMVNLLQLDIRLLRDHRADALQRVFDHAFMDSVTNDELARLAEGYRQPGANKQWKGFGHVLARYAEQQFTSSSQTF
jgi:uncharacterized protein (TIGR02646 family)